MGCAMTTLTLRVRGMTCRHCVRKVTAVLRDVPGVQLVQADLTTATVVLRGEHMVADVLAALDEAGFPATVLPTPTSSATPARRAGP
jgi:copper chaperone